jgi:alpha,alpha-trehalase
MTLTETKLFCDVQLMRLFGDSKTFVDATPIENLEEITKFYEQYRVSNEFDMKKFINNHFEIPNHIQLVAEQKLQQRLAVTDHIELTWKALERAAQNPKPQSTLLPLPFPYVVAGGRFGEMYYWDSFFTSLGLIKSGRIQTVIDLCQNFKYLISTYGHIPNGTRTYFVGRSQPPFFVYMLELIKPFVTQPDWESFVDSLETEYQFWMSGTQNLHKDGDACLRVVQLDDGTILNRYFGGPGKPREEAYYEDVHLGSEIPDDKKGDFYRNLRAGAESGWDFSSRWNKIPEKLDSICTTELLPVDLNCLLYQIESKLAEWFQELGETHKQQLYSSKADARATAIRTVFWSDNQQYYMDYNFVEKKHTHSITLAGIFPLFTGIATRGEAVAVKNLIKTKLLKKGGVVTTLEETGQQWDSPNGWAPLQWITVKGLEKYGFDHQAHDIKTRWIKTCSDYYLLTGKLIEKYNVVYPLQAGGGGEYAVQEGFGWTNGVLLDFLTPEDTNRS